jgi:hypothetical protein
MTGADYFERRLNTWLKIEAPARAAVILAAIAKADAAE